MGDRYTVNPEIGKRIRVLREERGLSMDQLCAEMGISKAFLRDVEYGIRRVNIDLLARLADFFNVTTEYLLCRANERLPEIPESAGGLPPAIIELLNTIREKPQFLELYHTVKHLTPGQIRKLAGAIKALIEAVEG